MASTIGVNDLVGLGIDRTCGVGDKRSIDFLVCGVCHGEENTKTCVIDLTVRK